MSIPGAASPLFLATTAGAADAFEISRSLRFNSGDSAYLNRTPSSAGNRKTWTWSGWVKRSALGSATTLFSADASNSDFITIRFESDTIRVDCQGDGQGRVQVTTTAVYRDPASFLHLVIALDTTQSTAADRCKIYVNSVLQATSNTLSQNKNFTINATVGHEIGRRTDGNDHYFDGYLAEVNFVDGSQLAPTSFGEFDNNGVWQAKDTAGLTFGTNGFRLKFADNSSNAALGTDSSGNSNTWTVNNLTAAAPSTATITHARIYCSYGGGTRGANYSVDYSDNGSSWTTAFTGNMTASGCGLITGTGVGNGSYGAHKYWRYVIGSATNDHHPNSARYVLSDGTTDYNIVVYYADNCNDQGNFQSVDRILTFPANPEGVDSLVDTPTNAATPSDSGIGGEVVGNYCTLNPLTSSGYTISNGNLQVDSGSGSNRLLGTIGVSSGKYYFEAVFNSHTGANDSSFLVVRNEDGFEAGIRNRTADIVYFTSSGGNLGTYSSSNWSTSDVHGFALDCDNSQLKVYKNNTLTATISLTANKTYFPGYYRDGSNGSFTFNFGQRAFAYPPNTGPVYSDNASTSGSTSTGTKANAFNGSITDYWQTSANASQTYTFSLVQTGTLEVYQSGTGTEYDIAINGGSASSMTRGASNGWETIASNASTLTSVTFTRPRGSNNQVATWAFRVNGTDILIDGLGEVKTLSTASLPTPTIADGSKYFDTKLVSGNSSTQTVSGLNFSPDFVWAKSRSHSTDHYLFDIVRGATNELKSNSTSAEGSNSGLTQFNSDGYNMGSDSSMNTSGRTYANWVWDGGTSTVTNNDGSIASTVRANPSAGFSIVSFDPGSTTSDQSVGHGLNDAPSLILLKNREDAGNWLVFDSSVCTTVRKLLRLNTTDGLVTESVNVWGGSLPSSTTFGVTVTVSASQNKDHIAYCFAPVAGYSAMGKYTGNGSTDGVFVYTGFRPAWLLLKNTTSSGEMWFLLDSSRDPENPNTLLLQPNTSDQEFDNATNYSTDLLSNGFKLRSSTSRNNSSGDTFIYIAFAENPFQANGGLAR